MSSCFRLIGGYLASAVLFGSCLAGITLSSPMIPTKANAAP